MKNGEDDECLTRRKFLADSAVTASGTLLFLCGCGQNPLASGKGLPQQAPGIQGTGAGQFVFSFADYPSLQNVGGSVQTTLQTASGPKSVFITRVTSGSVITVSTVCTHAGCTLNPYDSAAEDYTCPCHNSVFNSQGAVVTGPAVTPLPTYASEISSSGVTVTAT